MNRVMLKTELYKLFSRKVVWVAMALFLLLFLAVKLQFIAKPGVVYTLEPVRGPLIRLVVEDSFQEFIRSRDYNVSGEDLRPLLPPEVTEYIGGFQNNNLANRSLNTDLVRILNNYCERLDNREEYIRQLEKDVSAGGNAPLDRAKEKLLAQYREHPVTLQLNLGPAANNFIDVNHTVVFSGAIMLVVLMGLSGSFSDEYTCGTEAALLTTRRGRSGVFCAKALAALLFVLVVVLGMEGFFFLVTAICYHGPGTTITAASTYGLSLTSYAGTVWGFCLRQVVGNLLTGIAMGSLTLCLSSVSRSALIPFFGAGLFYGGTALWGNTIPFPPFLSTLLTLPGELSPFLLQTQVELVAAGHYTSVFGLVVPTLTLSVILHLFSTAGLLTICFFAYTRKQVKG